MIKAEEFKAFVKKLEDTRDEYCKKIDEKEAGEMSYTDKIVVQIWNNRIEHISSVLGELDILEYDLFV